MLRERRKPHPHVLARSHLSPGSDAKRLPQRTSCVLSSGLRSQGQPRVFPLGAKHSVTRCAARELGAEGRCQAVEAPGEGHTQGDKPQPVLEAAWMLFLVQQQLMSWTTQGTHSPTPGQRRGQIPRPAGRRVPWGNWRQAGRLLKHEGAETRVSQGRGLDGRHRGWLSGDLGGLGSS